MSLHLEFEPHSWYMGFAIKRTRTSTKVVGIRNHWNAYIDNGMTGYIDELEANTLSKLKQEIRGYFNRQAIKDLYNRWRIGEYTDAEYNDKLSKLQESSAS